MTQENILPAKQIRKSVPRRVKQLVRGGRSSQKDVPRSVSRGREVATEALIPLLRAVGALAALSVLAGLFWVASDLRFNSGPSIATAEQACTRALAHHTQVVSRAELMMLEAINSESSWLIRGRATTEDEFGQKEYGWSCRYFIDLGISRVLDFEPAEQAVTASADERPMLLTLLADAGLWR